MWPKSLFASWEKCLVDTGPAPLHHSPSLGQPSPHCRTLTRAEFYGRHTNSSAPVRPQHTLFTLRPSGRHDRGLKSRTGQQLLPTGHQASSRIPPIIIIIILLPSFLVLSDNVATLHFTLQYESVLWSFLFYQCFIWSFHYFGLFYFLCVWWSHNWGNEQNKISFVFFFYCIWQ